MALFNVNVLGDDEITIDTSISTRIGHARVNLSSVTIHSTESNAVKRPGFADVEA